MAADEAPESQPRLPPAVSIAKQLLANNSDALIVRLVVDFARNVVKMVALTEISLNIQSVSQHAVRRLFEEAVHEQPREREEVLVRERGSSGAAEESDVAKLKKLMERHTSDSAASLSGDVGVTSQNILAFFDGARDRGDNAGVFKLRLLYLCNVRGLWSDRFDLVYGAELREKEVHRATSLAELLAVNFRSMGLHREEIIELAAYFNEHPSRLCIVLDGLDECRPEMCSSFILRLLARNTVPEADLVVISKVCEEAERLVAEGRYHHLLVLASLDIPVL